MTGAAPATSRVIRLRPAGLLGLGLITLCIAAADGRVLGAAAAPSAPTNLSALVSGSTVALSWQPGAGSTGATFWLEAGSTPGAANIGAWPTMATQLTAAGVPDGRYFVRVRAVSGAGASGYSNEVDVRVGCGAALVAPQSLTGSVTGTAVALSWTPVAGASGYLVEAGSAPGLANLASVPTGVTSLAANVPAGTYYVRVRALSPCGAGDASNEVVLRVGVTPPPTTLPIWGVVDASVLGTCSAATHDTWTVDGGDGYRYRTWHPQVDPSGCVYAHEHGDDPARSTNATISASAVRFGYIGRRMNHEEAHEGFKVFIANRGDVNDEGRVNRVYSRSVFHMGTGGPKRFGMPHHSAETRLIHPEFGLAAFTQLMMDTGATGAVCDPRSPAPVKDVIQLQSPCKLGSAYEIWSTTQAVRYQGRDVYTAFATPAVFDPITVLNPANPAELVYAWDARVAAIKLFTDDWSHFRGCDRESYAQPGYWRNAGGPTTFYTDAMGNEVPASDPNALVQQIAAVDSIGAPATSDGLVQFKMRRSYCQQRAMLGLKN